MPLVNGYRESLQRLQDVWDQLALLGQMSGIAADITTTAQEFRALTGTLLGSLAQALLRNTLHRMQAQAQVVVDILVRNLFERTADVGFLATDSALREFLLASEDDADAGALRKRFHAYVAKYSVYDDVIVLAPDGNVRVRLDDRIAVSRCDHPLLSQALQPETPFVESFGAIDVLGGRRGLIYSAAIRDPRTRRVLGVLCLSFRFDDEMAAIFKHLAPLGPCSAVVLSDADGVVIASSDVWHVPIGAQLSTSRARDNRLFFGGREYLATEVSATGYQGYAGPGWKACTLVPIEQAFRGDTGEAIAGSARTFPAGALNNSSLVADELRSIPLQARRIQRGLERSVWNGEVRGRQRTDGNIGFGAALLRQVTNTGAGIKSVIEDAIGDLQRSTSNAILDEAQACASLAIGVMDRNLYERANDCRWWALDATLQQALEAPGQATREAAGQVLAHINGLYTVYASLLLIDSSGRVVAASNEAGAAWVDQTLSADWVRSSLALRDGQAHVRSPFEASPLYGDRSTYVYAAGVRTQARTGAVAVVFDGAPQFEAMLRDTLPKSAAGEVMPEATGLFVTRSGQVVSSTDTSAFPIGAAGVFHDALHSLARGESHQWVMTRGGVAYAAGASMSRGYREYNSGRDLHDDDVACVVLIQVGACGTDAEVGATTSPVVAQPITANADTRQLASFYCAGEWLALDAVGVVEAIDAPHLTQLPGSRASVAGVVMHGNEAVTVIDLRALRHTEASGRAASASPVILCKGRGRSTFGLRVDELGQVLDIAPSDVKPVAGYLAAHDRHAEGVLSFKGADQKQMLTLLSVGGLAAEFSA